MSQLQVRITHACGAGGFASNRVLPLHVTRFTFMSPCFRGRDPHRKVKCSAVLRYLCFRHSATSSTVPCLCAASDELARRKSPWADDVVLTSVWNNTRSAVSMRERGRGSPSSVQPTSSRQSEVFYILQNYYYWRVRHSQ